MLNLHIYSSDDVNFSLAHEKHFDSEKDLVVNLAIFNVLLNGAKIHSLRNASDIRYTLRMRKQFNSPRIPSEFGVSVMKPARPMNNNEKYIDN